MIENSFDIWWVHFISLFADSRMDLKSTPAYDHICLFCRKVVKSTVLNTTTLRCWNGSYIFSDLTRITIVYHLFLNRRGNLMLDAPPGYNLNKIFFFMFSLFVFRNFAQFVKNIFENCIPLTTWPYHGPHRGNTEWLIKSAQIRLKHLEITVLTGIGR